MAVRLILKPVNKFSELRKPIGPKTSVPEGLRIFLSSIKSEIQDPRNRNQALPNISDDEMEAMKQLIQLQRERKIVVKAYDKGAGIIVITFVDYMQT